LDDASFDLAYVRYVLEHVADPVRVLREMRRVVRPGGYVVAQENDNSLQRLDPPCPLFERAWQAFMALQADIGGDSFIGRKLFRLFKAAGFTHIELSVQPELHWAGSAGFRSWVSNLAGNLESGREALLARGAVNTAELTGALAELETFAERTDASTTFVWNRARAISPG
jgi:SAM-dependent methyltransferase